MRPFDVSHAESLLSRKLFAPAPEPPDESSALVEKNPRTTTSWGKHRKSKVQVTNNIAARTVCLGGRTQLLPRIIMLGEGKGAQVESWFP